MLDIPQMGVTAWFWGFVFMLLVIILMRNLLHSSEGAPVLSVREDETGPRAMGIDIASQKLFAFVGSLFAGLGGGVYVLHRPPVASVQAGLIFSPASIP